MRYSALQLLRQGLRGNRFWPPLWSQTAPLSRYDVVVVGGGGHGLATAYYLARRHGITRVAVLEKGWLGGGNTARNTTIVRSNYLAPPSVRFYDYSLSLYERLSQELNYNIMLSQRGVVTLAFSRHELRQINRRVNALNIAGVDADLLTVDQIAECLPLLRMKSPAGRQVYGGFVQKRGGTARHDAVAWGYARAAHALGVHIVQDCTVTGFRKRGNAVMSIETSLGEIQTERVGVAVAGHSSLLAAKAGLELPLVSTTLQAMVSEPIAPMLDTVLDGAFYVSQSDRGELVMGGASDVIPSYARRSGIQRLQDNMASLVDLFPAFSNLRLMRQWAGTVDLTPDGSPIISPTGIEGLNVSCGWGTYGFKAIPAGGVCFAQLLATGTSHPLAAPFSLDRFRTGALVDEAGSSGLDSREPLL